MKGLHNFIDVLSSYLSSKGIYMLTSLLFFLGVYGIARCTNYMKKLICMNIMQVAVIFFFLCLGQKNGGTLPVLAEGLNQASDYINPLPHALMLTAIVVSLGTTGVGLALLMRLKEKYGTIEEEEIIAKEEEFARAEQRAIARRISKAHHRQKGEDDA